MTEGIIQGTDGSATIYAPTARIVVGTPHDLDKAPACPLCGDPVTYEELLHHAAPCAARHPQSFARLLRDWRPG